MSEDEPLSGTSKPYDDPGLDAPRKMIPIYPSSAVTPDSGDYDGSQRPPRETIQLGPVKRQMIQLIQPDGYSAVAGGHVDAPQPAAANVVSPSEIEARAAAWNETIMGSSEIPGYKKDGTPSYSPYAMSAKIGGLFTTIDQEGEPFDATIAAIGPAFERPVMWGSANDGEHVQNVLSAHYTPPIEGQRRSVTCVYTSYSHSRTNQDRDFRAPATVRVAFQLPETDFDQFLDDVSAQPDLIEALMRQGLGGVLGTSVQRIAAERLVIALPESDEGWWDSGEYGDAEKLAARAAQDPDQRFDFTRPQGETDKDGYPLHVGS